MDSITPELHRFGYDHFRPYQREAIEALVEGQDVLLILPTGGGKSLVYQMASLLRPGLGIVVSPLLALMDQQVRSLRTLGIRAEFLNSSLNPGEQDDLVWSLRHDQVDILFLSPEKLMQPSVYGFLSHLNVGLFAIDEAHCIAQWGNGFRPEYSQLSMIREEFPDVPLIAMTGTAHEGTQDDIARSLRLRDEVRLVQSFNRANIHLEISQKRQAKHQLLSFLVRDCPGQSGIVYCRSRKKVEQTSAWLNQLGLKSVYYHAAMSAEQKQQTAERFYQENGTVLCATTAFGMGMDFPSVRFVVHLDLPSSIEAYYQEVGRAGRDGRPARALLLYGLQDFLQLLQFEQDLSGAWSAEAEQRLTELFAFLEARGCRRKALLRHFGETMEECGHCDRCLAHPSEQNATVAAQKLLSLIYHTRGRIGIATLIQILQGKESKVVKDVSGQRFDLFGKGRELSESGWKSLFRYLLSHRSVSMISMTPQVLKLNEKARAILRGEEQVILTMDNHRPVLLPEQLEEGFQFWQSLMRWHQADDRNTAVSLHHLRKIADQKPTSVQALSRLTGLNQNALEYLGPELIRLIQGSQQKIGI